MRLVLLLLLSFLPVAAFSAAPQPTDKYLANCFPTPSVKGGVYPGRGVIVKSNKLALPAGKSIYPNGQLLYISGRVLDENCVPVSGAVIDIWQTDPKGHYVNPTLGDRMSPYPYFTGSGRAVSDNLGRFNFVTLFPGPYADSHNPSRVSFHAPHINMRIMRKHFATLDTELFFAGDRRNAGDSDLIRLSPDHWDDVMAKVWLRHPNRPEDGLYGQWDITLHGKNQFRHF